MLDWRIIGNSCLLIYDILLCMIYVCIMMSVVIICIDYGYSYNVITLYVSIKLRIHSLLHNTYRWKQ